MGVSDRVDIVVAPRTQACHTHGPVLIRHFFILSALCVPGAWKGCPQGNDASKSAMAMGQSGSGALSGYHPFLWVHERLSQEANTQDLSASPG